MKTVKPTLGNLCVVCLITILSGCASTQSSIANGSAFASAGIAYVDAIPAVFDESFALTVAANSHQLLLSREDLTEDERSDQLSAFDEQLQQRLSLLRDLRRHSLLLRSYFLALQSLVASENASGINSAAEDVVTRLIDLRPSIAEKSVGGAKITDLISPGISLIVGGYQATALRRELTERGEAIEREFALQKAVVSALVDQMTDDAQLIILIEELNPIFEEYVTGREVRADWSDRRVAAFKRTVDLDSYDDIRKAADNMHSTWIALVEKRDTEATISLLIEDIEQLLAVARLFGSKD